MKTLIQLLGVAFVTTFVCIVSAESYGADYYVDGTSGIDSPSPGSKTQPWKTINYALHHITGTAGTPHRVFVSGGNYGENVVVDPYESIYGGYNPTTWAYEPDTQPTTIRAPSAGSVVVLGEQSVVDGFTLRNGNRDYGGGVYCQNVTATISNCLITQNQATKSGSAIYVKGGDVQIISNIMEKNTESAVYIDGGSVSLRDNVIQDTTSGSGIYAESVALNLHRDRILRNQGYGVYVSEGTLTASGCVIGENSYTGVYVYHASGSLRQCTLSRNNIATWSSEGGIYSARTVTTIDQCVICQTAYYAISGKVRIVDSVIVSNRSTSSWRTNYGCDFSGGTILTNNLFVNNGDITVSDPLTSTNNTFVVNDYAYHAGYLGTPANMRITNDILWENGDDIAFPASYANQTNVTYCNISDGDFSGSNGNISVNPNFVGKVGAGTITAIKYDRQNCRTILTDSESYYVPGALARTFVWVGNTNTAFYVETNTHKEITVLGDVTQVGGVGFKYTVLDYRLNYLSLCVDAGTNVGAPDQDFEGDPRPLQGQTADNADMGADEYNPTARPACSSFPPGDINQDCVVDWKDFAVLAEHWLKCNRIEQATCWD